MSSDKKISKDDYILRRLAKVSNKKWEFYVISRIIHKLDDPEIEFVTQQLVRRKNGKRALTDLFFPQFNIHLEVDEGQHESELQKEADKKRTEDIQLIAKHEVERIKVAKRIEPNAVKDLPLNKVIPKVDKFIDLIKEKKRKQLESGKFEPWDFDSRYCPERHIKIGSISSEENVVFEYQWQALSCFGYSKGHYQRGAWRIPDETGDVVWFPRLYETKNWDNELTFDGKKIFERPLSDKSKQTIKTDLKHNIVQGNRIVFAKAKDPLGYSLYKYVGTFRLNLERSKEQIVQYDLVKKVEKIRRSI